MINRTVSGCVESKKFAYFFHTNTEDFDVFLIHLPIAYRQSKAHRGADSGMCSGATCWGRGSITLAPMRSSKTCLIIALGAA